MNDETALAPIAAQAMAPAGLFGTSEPRQIVQKATATASALADVIDKRRLFTMIQGRKHVQVEGWTLLGSMLGVFPKTEWTRELPEGNGWEARVVAVTINGAEVGAAEAMCTRKENTWANREDFAIRSMAQTRATAKALRMPLGFVMQLAGYATTPKEEMTPEEEEASAEEMATLIRLAETLPTPRDEKRVGDLVKRYGYAATYQRVVAEHSRECGPDCAHLTAIQGELI